MAPVKPILTVLEWLGVGGGLLRAFSLAVAALLLAPFQRSKGPPSFSRHLSYAISRALVSGLTPKALVATSPSTDEAYQKFIADEKLNSQSITIPDGTHAHWLGDQSAEKLMLYFHGGGYLMSAVDAHFKLLHATIRAVEEQGGKLAVLFLSYDVSLQSPYPRQLQQASGLLKHVLATLGKQPEDIILAGDSAGGNLVLALLSHILHPHPQVETIQVQGHFASACLLSPWVTFDDTAKSMRANQYRDVLAVPTLNKWSKLFKGNAELDPYLEPLSAPTDWWKGLPVEKVLVLAGEHELFVDDIQRFAKQLEIGCEGVVLKTVAQEAHDHLVMEFLMKETRSQQREVFERWICDVTCSEDINADDDVF